jgi:hypothetical protein
VSHVYLLPASNAFPYHVGVFLMVLYWMLEELIPARNEVTTVRIATPIPTLSVTVGLPSTGSSNSGLRLRRLTAVM